MLDSLNLKRLEVRKDIFRRMQDALECFKKIPAAERCIGTEDIQPEFIDPSLLPDLHPLCGFLPKASWHDFAVFAEQYLDAATTQEIVYKQNMISKLRSLSD